MSLIHIHRRKRASNKKLEPYPHFVKWKRYIDILIYIVGFLGPIFTIPQIYKIWFMQSALGLSLITWLAYFVGSIIFLFYGVVHKAKPLIIIYTAGALANLVVVIGILIF
jgi:uncharacterized protein with PQ loop repeat